MTDQQQSGPRWWLLQVVGWGVVAASGLVSIFAHSARVLPMVAAYRGTLLVSEILSSIPVWLLCRWLWKRPLPWLQRIMASAVLCYPLGFFCALAAQVAAQRVSGVSIVPWVLTRSSVLQAVGEGVANSFVLIAWSGIYFGVKQWQETEQREQQLWITQTLAQKAQLRALGYQLAPHFLLNTLNGISALIGEGRNQEARRMIARLGDFFRSTLQDSDETDVTLRWEIDHIKHYLDVEAIRLGDRLQSRFEISPEVYEVLLPKLLLQPLVENAIRHGIAPYAGPVEIVIRAEQHGDRAQITVRNRRLGNLTGDLPIPNPNVGVGLANIKERLSLRYDRDYRFEVQDGTPETWAVVIEVPFSKTPQGVSPKANQEGLHARAGRG